MSERSGDGRGQDSGQNSGQSVTKFSWLTDDVINSQLALIEWDNRLRVQNWSTKAESIFGWAADEVMGRNFSEWRFIFDEDRDRIAKATEDFLRERRKSITEYARNYTKDGRVVECVWYSTAKFNIEGEIESIVSIVADETTTRKKSVLTECVSNERTNERTAELMRQSLAAAKMGCWDWDLKTNEILWLGGIDETLGTAPKIFRNGFKDIAAFIHPVDRERVLCEVTHAIKTKSSYNQVYRIMAAGGKVRWISSSGRLQVGEDGEPRRLTGTAVDITEQKESEERLRAEKVSAESSSALKSAFVANMSHEIRTPLGVIIGFSELLADPDLTAAERSDYMRVINRNGQHLSRLIDDILDLSRVEAGRLEVTPVVFEIRACLEELLSSLQSKAFDKSIRLKVDYLGDIPEKIFTDHVRFKQIVTNLVNNAIKFTADGEVRITVTSSLQHGLSVRVQDTGIGISEHGQKLLFEAFAQADRSLTRRFGGTGLGLALSRKIARSMGGDVELIHSSHGKGSVFELHLPRLIFDIPAELKAEMSINYKLTNTSEPSATDLHNIRVLLAEDSLDNQVLMSRMLMKRGASVTIASDGQEAVAKALLQDFDVVLMDIQMPVLDGYRATKRLREKGYEKPIVALTAHAMKEERQRCLNAGCNAHLSKPTDASELARVLVQLVRESSPHFHQL